MKTDVSEESSSLHANEKSNSQKNKSGDNGTASFTTAPGAGGGLLGDWGPEINMRMKHVHDNKYKLIHAQSLRHQKNEKLAKDLVEFTNFTVSSKTARQK